MPARALGSATISFGLVSIPIKLYSASSSDAGVHFNLLHDKCGSRLKQQYICPQDNETVTHDHMVKGYEFSKGKFVQFTKEEIKALEEKPTQSIDISEFVPVEQVDLVYYDKAYYLGPDRGGERAYNLLGKAMQKTGRVALARYAARGKQYLVLLRISGDLIIMQQLHYANEIRTRDDVPVTKTDVKDSELQLATQLIEQISHATFNPEQYADDVTARIEQAIARKVEGQEISLAPTEEPRAQIVDLMAALKASLGVEPGAEPTKKPARRVERAKSPAKSRKASK